jgi:hypothetical protein
MTGTKTMKLMVAAALLLLGVAGCGGGDTGGGVAIFKTVYVNKPQLTTANPFLSDLANWSDTNGDSKIEICGNDGYSIKNDFASTDITVKASSSSTNPSSVLVETGSLTFRPADTNTHELPPIFREQPLTPNVLIGPGETKSISVELVNHDMKAYLDGQILCTGLTWNYYVKISYNLVEISTGERKTIETEMLVRFTDFAD